MLRLCPEQQISQLGESSRQRRGQGGYFRNHLLVLQILAHLCHLRGQVHNSILIILRQIGRREQRQILGVLLQSGEDLIPDPQRRGIKDRQEISISQLGLGGRIINDGFAGEVRGRLEGKARLAFSSRKTSRNVRNAGWLDAAAAGQQHGEK